MKIQYIDKPCKTAMFEDIYDGEVFEYEEEVYIKLDSGMAYRISHQLDYDCFDPEEQVTLLNATLTVERMRI